MMRLSHAHDGKQENRQTGGRATVFLKQFLADGPRSSRDLWQAAQEVALSARTLQRAKRGLGIRCRRIYTDGRSVSYWLLPGQELATGSSDTDEFDRLLAEMGKQYPPPTPLDEEDYEDERE